jgi:L-alanine-DL-glutamate epimerase-like enolase superfamily enzyme
MKRSGPMTIIAHEIRACRVSGDDLPLKGKEAEALEFVVHTVRTSAGLSASMFGFAGKSAMGTAHHAAASLRPFLLGRNALAREEAWQDWRHDDRWWHHLPIYAYGPVDCCLWLLAAEAAEMPLWQFLGGGRRTIPVYASSLVLADAEAYAAEATAVKEAGFAGYKIHPPGLSLAADIVIHEAVRSAVGPAFPLMSDPVQPYTAAEALRLGRILERLDYLWLEEPLPDENIGALRDLARTLDIPVIAGEVIAKHPYSLAEMIASRAVDGVRADVSWSGGVTGVLKTAHLAEAFHMNCEIHTTIFHPLELVNLHVASTLRNTGSFEVLWPMERFGFGLAERLPIVDGAATLPDGPGLGIDLDWDMIENATIAIL